MGANENEEIDAGGGKTVNLKNVVANESREIEQQLRKNRDERAICYSAGWLVF